MLVHLDPSAEEAALQTVRDRAAALGLTTTVFATPGGRTMLLAGDNAADAADALSALPGVLTVIPAENGERPVTSNLRIAGIRPLVPPAILVEQLPLPIEGANLVHRSRGELARILNRDDDRLIVIVGPCSIHDPDAALEYARLLADAQTALRDDLCIVMRVYFEKPRTTVGWKGLINDPRLDGSFAVNEGLAIARRFLLDVIALGLPAGCEFLDPISPQFIADAVSWAAIGARTTESQVHRNLTSGLSMPVGFKNGTGGDIQIAIDAMGAAAFPHQFMSVTEQGLAAIVETRGNRDTHVILRGGNSGPNYDAESVQRTLAALAKNAMPERVMIDTSHGNSAKDFHRQPVAAAAVAQQIASGERGIIGVMMESFLVDGRQALEDRSDLTAGQSITDACMGWEMTLPVLHGLAHAVRDRRANAAKGGS